MGKNQSVGKGHTKWLGGPGCGPRAPVAHLCSGNLKNAKNYFIEAKIYKLTESVILRQTMFQPWASEGFFPGGDQ